MQLTNLNDFTSAYGKAIFLSIQSISVVKLKLPNPNEPTTSIASNRPLHTIIGLVLLVQGIGSLIGPPMSGILCKYKSRMNKKEFMLSQWKLIIFR